MMKAPCLQGKWFTLYDNFFLPRNISPPSNPGKFESFIRDIFNNNPELWQEITQFLNDIENYKRGLI